MPSAELPPFDQDDFENEILSHLIFNQNVESEMEQMEIIVRELCAPLPPDHPARLEKLLNVLEFKEAIKLYLILPAGSVTSKDLSPRSKLQPFILDFIEDARDLLKMTRDQIFDTVLSHKSAETAKEFEEALQLELENKVKESQLQGQEDC